MFPFLFIARRFRRPPIPTLAYATRSDRRRSEKNQAIEKEMQRRAELLGAELPALGKIWLWVGEFTHCRAPILVRGLVDVHWGLTDLDFDPIGSGLLPGFMWGLSPSFF